MRQQFWDLNMETIYDQVTNTYYRGSVVRIQQCLTTRHPMHSVRETMKRSNEKHTERLLLYPSVYLIHTVYGKHVDDVVSKRIVENSSLSPFILHQNVFV